MKNPDQPILKTAKLHKSYGKKTNRFEALKGIDLAISRGESIAIIGKSGSGKSTLMHLLAGLDKPTNGNVYWSDQSISRMNEKQITNLRNTKVGFIFQQFFLQPTLTVLENTYLPLKIAGISSHNRKKLAKEALKSVDLLDKSDNLANDLSGGQRQRVAIARALINNPEVIFADEPTGNLDSETGKQIIELLFSLQKKNNITLIIVTHDEDLAKKCDRIIKISDGKIIK